MDSARKANKDLVIGNIALVRSSYNLTDRHNKLKVETAGHKLLFTAHYEPKDEE